MFAGFSAGRRPHDIVPAASADLDSSTAGAHAAAPPDDGARRGGAAGRWLQGARQASVARLQKLSQRRAVPVAEHMPTIGARLVLLLLEGRVMYDGGVLLACQTSCDGSTCSDAAFEPCIRAPGGRLKARHCLRQYAKQSLAAWRLTKLWLLLEASSAKVALSAFVIWALLRS